MWNLEKVRLTDFKASGNLSRDLVNLRKIYSEGFDY